MGELRRGERLQIMLSNDELAALDQWRFSKHMPSRASAIRELLKRGLAAEGFEIAQQGFKSKDFGIIDERDEESDEITPAGARNDPAYADAYTKK